jgi:cell division initiation protein
MTHIQQETQDFPYYRSPSAIRDESFSHRMRGVDEAEVREFLDLLADQVQACDAERAQLRVDNARLTKEADALRAQQPVDGEINPQAVLLFSQAQQVADQLVEEAVIHARDLMTSARNQQREILEQAHKAAESAAGAAAKQAGHDMVASAAATQPRGYSPPVPQVEYVRTFARVAQVQLRSVLDALAEQVDRLGEVPDVDGEGRSWFAQETTTRVVAQRDWRVEPVPPQRPSDIGL